MAMFALSRVTCYLYHILYFVVQETYGAMAKAEKIAFILEQVRLCLEKGDFVR